MPLVTISELTELQKSNNIRNISVVAHVDHGKTTLTDSLIASNGIFSQRNAGKIRYMDFTPEEQQRGITMKSASISLVFSKKNEEDKFLINLIDSPGHLDFTQEVSSALRVTDGCIVLIDAVEGVCIQTRIVLRQAWKERVKPVLMVNKIDKLFTKLHMTISEAYNHLKKVMTEINMISSELWVEEGSEIKAKEEENSASHNEENQLLFFVNNLPEDDGEYFSPAKGNVVFGSALGGWGFQISDFIEVYHKKLGIPKETLLKSLWGDYYYVIKKKEIVDTPPNDNAIPMFAQFILKPFWDIYGAFFPTKNDEMIGKILTGLNINMTEREMKCFETPGATVAGICQRWLPISESILRMVVDIVPNPVQAHAIRIPVLWKPNSILYSNDIVKEQQLMKESMKLCDRQAPNVVCFISKIFCVSNDQIAYRKGDPILDKDKQSFIGFGRIFSGTLKVGDKIYVLGPKYSPSNPKEHCSLIEVTNLYLMMGRTLEPIDEISAGNVFGIGNIDFLKTVTLSTSQACVSFDKMASTAAPIVRAAVDAVDSAQLPQLREGLRLLNIGDSGCEVYVQKTGEYIVAAQGELHLKHCLDDLKRIYAKIDITFTPPLVSFKETITHELDRSLSDGKNEIVIEKTTDQSLQLTVTAYPIPPKIAEFLDKHETEVNAFCQKKENWGANGLSSSSDNIIKQEDDVISDIVVDSENTFLEQMKAVFDEAGPEWSEKFSRIWAFSGPNLLLNKIEEYSSPLWTSVTSPKETKQNQKSINSSKKSDLFKLIEEFDNSIITGFRLVTDAGPLCMEPMYGVAFEIKDITYDFSLSVKERDAMSTSGPLSGQIISTVRKACELSFLRRSQRLVEAMFECHVQIYGGMDLQGKAYSVLNRRRSKILKEDIKEGSNIYEITAYMPVVASFGFADELFTTSSGAAHGQLVFSHWQILDQDPNWIPKTEEEKEDTGYNVASLGNNLARQYIDNVRRRKGLMVKEIVEKSKETKVATLQRKK
jgi:ribosome assembly protein 1